jgi:hypothetical protein
MILMDMAKLLPLESSARSSPAIDLLAGACPQARYSFKVEVRAAFVVLLTAT